MIYELNEQELISYLNSFNRKNKIDNLLYTSNNTDKYFLKNIPNHKLKIIKMLSLHGIICGSLALKLYGVLSRRINGIDLITNDSGYIYLKSKYKKYSEVNHYFKFSKISKYRIDSLYIEGLKVDIFIKEDVSYKEHDGIKLQTFAEIIAVKSELKRGKDLQDLKEVITRIENSQYFFLQKSSLFKRMFERFYKYI